MAKPTSTKGDAASEKRDEASPRKHGLFRKKGAASGQRKRPHPIKAVKGFLHRHKRGLIKGLLIVLVLLVCAIPVPFVNNAIGYIPLIAVVCLIVISFVYLQVLKHSLSFSEESLLPSCERGSDIEFTVNFRNSSPLVFTHLEATFYISDLFGDVDVAIPASLPLMPFEKRDFGFMANFDHIGTYTAGVEKIVIGDLLGLFSHTIVNEHRHSVRVLPKLFEIENVELENVSVQETQTSPKPIVSDDMDYAGVREYAPGDPLKNIHWKLSARNPREEYFTRLFEVYGNPGISIIIDTCAPDYSHESLMQVFDGVVESALSIGHYAREKGMDTEIVYLDKAGERTKTQAVEPQDSDEFVDSLPRIHVADSYEGCELLRREGLSIYAQGNIAYCTSQLDETVITALIEIRNRRHSPLLFLVVPRELNGAEREDFLRPLTRLEEAQIPYFVISSAKDIEEGVSA